MFLPPTLSMQVDNSAVDTRARLACCEEVNLIDGLIVLWCGETTKQAET